MSRWLQSQGWRFWCLLLAVAALTLSLTNPTLPLPRAVFRYWFVIDITQSMNARDYHHENLPADRLGFVKTSIKHTLRALPCGSEVGLALFATQNAQMLFEPLEVCQHFAIVDDVLEHIDWRMAWSADSFIARGLFSAIRELAQRDPAVRLAFFSDGQQFPPQADWPDFHHRPGELKGLIVGVGGDQPVPIPRLDRDNRLQGFWEHQDLKGLLPPGQNQQEPAAASSYYSSRVEEAELVRLAALTGLGYHRLRTPEGLSAALRSPSLAENRIVAVDIRWLLALLALLLLLLTHR